MSDTLEAGADAESTRMLPDWLPPTAVVAMLALALWILHGELQALRWRDIAGALGSVPPGALLAAAGATTASYLLLGGYDRLALRYVGRSVPWARSALVAFIAFAFAHNLGASALTATAVRVRLYASHGLSALEAATVSGFCSLTAGLGLVTLIGGALLLQPAEGANVLHLQRGWVVALGCSALLLVVAYLL
jgi:uncharacterized membrane protein YbhN (UPF0104 family)